MLVNLLFRFWSSGRVLDGTVEVGVSCRVRKMQLRDFPGSPVVGTSPSKVGGGGSIPGQGAKIPHALQEKSQKIKQKQYCNQFSKDF